MMVSRPMPLAMPGVRCSASARLVSGPIIRRSTGSAVAVAADSVEARKPTASDPAMSAVRAGRGAPPSPSSPWTWWASTQSWASGWAAPVCTGMAAPATASVASTFLVAESRLTLPNTVVMASGARPAAISSSSAWASSTPPSVSRISLLGAIHASFLRQPIGVDVGIGGDLAALVGKPRVVDEGNRNDFRHRHGIGRSARDHRIDLLFRNTERPGSERARLLDTDTAMAQGTLLAFEQPFLIRVVQVDELVIVEVEHHPAERVLWARRHVMQPFVADHQGRWRPGGVELDGEHRREEFRGRGRRLADHDATAQDGDTVLEGDQLERRDVHQDEFAVRGNGGLDALAAQHADIGTGRRFGCRDRTSGDRRRRFRRDAGRVDQRRSKRRQRQDGTKRTGSRSHGESQPPDEILPSISGVGCLQTRAFMKQM